MDEVSLVATAREQSRRAAVSGSGRAATTVYGGRDRSLLQTVIALQAGQCLAGHEKPGEATVHVLSGRVRLAQPRRAHLLIVELPRGRRVAPGWICACAERAQVGRPPCRQW